MFVKYVKSVNTVYTDVHKLSDPASVRLQPKYNTEPNKVDIYCVNSGRLLGSYNFVNE